MRNHSYVLNDYDILKEIIKQEVIHTGVYLACIYIHVDRRQGACMYLSVFICASNLRMCLDEVMCFTQTRH